MERISANPASDRDGLIRLNALSSLTRMTASAARMRVRELGLGPDPSVRLTVVELVGGFGDAAMLPLLEQVLLLDKTAPMARAVERARRSIEARTASGAQSCCAGPDRP